MNITASIVLGLIGGMIAEKPTGERTGRVVAGITGTSGQAPRGHRRTTTRH